MHQTRIRRTCLVQELWRGPMMNLTGEHIWGLQSKPASTQGFTMPDESDRQAHLRPAEQACLHARLHNAWWIWQASTFEACRASLPPCKASQCLPHDRGALPAHPHYQHLSFIEKPIFWRFWFVLLVSQTPILPSLRFSNQALKASI